MSTNDANERERIGRQIRELERKKSIGDRLFKRLAIYCLLMPALGFIFMMIGVVFGKTVPDEPCSGMCFRVVPNFAAGDIIGPGFTDLGIILVALWPVFLVFNIVLLVVRRFVVRGIEKEQRIIDQKVKW